MAAFKRGFGIGDSRIADSFLNRDSVGEAILPNGIAILALYLREKKVEGDSESTCVRALRVALM